MINSIESVEVIGTFRNRIVTLLLLLLVLGSSSDALSCTTAVLSGSATHDGRPLLWKNRDSSSRDNVVLIFDKPGAYRCAVVTDKGVGEGGAIWMGMNEMGLCIENALCRDLQVDGFTSHGNGSFMRRTLETCASIEEFEALLEMTNGDRHTQASFGLIDRQGGAAIFETSPTGYVRYDANDTDKFPEGFVVRSNFSFTGQGGETECGDACIAGIYSGERYLSARNLLRAEAAKKHRVSADFLLRHISRDLTDGDGIPYPGTINGSLDALPETIDTSTTISRRSTVSSVVFHGVLATEDPGLTTMWTILGEPTFSVAVPVWAGMEAVSNFHNGPGGSPLCTVAIEIRDQHYTSDRTLNTEHLPTIWSANLGWEKEQFNAVNSMTMGWREAGVSSDELFEAHHQVAESAYRHLILLKESVGK